MNISTTILATAIFAFLLLPGFLFVRTIWGSSKGALNPQNIQNYLVWSVLISATFYYLLLPLFRDYIDFKLCYTFFFDAKSKQLEFMHEMHRDAVIDHLYKLFKVCFWITAFSPLFGYLIGILITAYRFDVKWKKLRFNNEWFYTFTGRGVVENFNESNTTIEFLTEINSSVILYRGEVIDYSFKNGVLEYVFLTSVERTGIIDWEGPIKPVIRRSEADLYQLNTDPKFYPVSQNRMLFKYEDMKNINFIYTKEDDNDKSDDIDSNVEPEKPQPKRRNSFLEAVKRKVKKREKQNA